MTFSFQSLVRMSSSLTGPRFYAADSVSNASGAVRGVPAYVVDPYGFVILRYPPGFDPSGLRADVARLVKLK